MNTNIDDESEFIGVLVSNIQIDRNIKDSFGIMRIDSK